MKKLKLRQINPQSKTVYFKTIEYYSGFSIILNQSLIFIFILLLPSQLGKHFFLPFSYLSGVRVDYLAPTIYITDIIACLLVLINFKAIFKFLTNRNFLFIVFLFFINIILAKSPGLALYRLLKIIEFLSVFIIFKNTRIDLNKIVLAFFLGGLIELFLSASQFINKHSLQGIFYLLGERAINLSTPGVAKASLFGIEILRPYATFSHPNSMAGFYLLLYFFILTNNKIVSNSILKYGLLLISSLLVLLSFSKLAIVLFIFFNILYLLKNFSRQICRLCIVSRIFVFMMIAFIFLTAKTDPLTIRKRIELIENASQIIINHPIFGVGLNHYLIAQNQVSIKYPYFSPQPVHNVFLLFLAESGIIISIFVLRPILRLIKKYAHSQVFVFFILVILTTGFFDHYWLTLQQNILLVGVLGGIIIRR